MRYPSVREELPGIDWVPGILDFLVDPELKNFMSVIYCRTEVKI